MRIHQDNKNLWGSSAQHWSVQENTFIPLYEKVLEQINLNPKHSIIDIGCGTGIFLMLASRFGCEITGIDLSQSAVDSAKERLPKGTFINGNMETIEFADNTFDFVFGNNSFQYADDLQKTFLEVYRILKNMGSLLISVWGKPDECDSFSYFKVFNKFSNQPDNYTVPFNLSKEGEIESSVSNAGFKFGRKLTVTCQRYYPDTQTALTGILSSGPAKKAINYSSYDKVKQAVLISIEKFKKKDGSINMYNNFILAEGIKI